MNSNNTPSFLSIVAADLLEHFQTDMHDVTVVFPGKRAGMFLDREFPLLTDKAVWTPNYCTMGDLFYALTPLQEADPLECICTLHGVMQDVLGPEYDETLDQFWSWGEVLMADFDDIDKHLGNAEAIFTNIADNERLWNLDYLDDSQRETLKRFFGRFSLDNSTEMQRRFLHTWSHMYEIYTELHRRMMAEGKLWEGAIFRLVTEQMRSDDTLIQKLLEGKRAVAFAGFNVLNSVEHRMMCAIEREGKARFYWDYDIYYCDPQKEHEAGFFMKQNLRDFPSAIADTSVFDNFSHLKDFTLIACTADNAAARYANTWLSEHQQNGDTQAKQAVILCNEALMPPLLHAIPATAKMVNVTMGFPVTDTPVHGLLMALLRLQIEGYDAQRQRFRFPFEQTLRQQPLFELLREEDVLVPCCDDSPALLRYLLQHIRTVATHFARNEKPDIFEQLYSETTYRIDRILNTLLNITTRPEHPLVILPTTLRRLLRSMLVSTKIPFHSQPDLGLQMMGVLETRCLDFEHMLMLSVEENVLPRSTTSNSFIPANLREAFGLTTPRHRIAVSAYYFYRLLQRATHVTCVYNESTDGSGQHEMSRFLRQILAETDIPIRTQWLRSKPDAKPVRELEVKKTPEVIQFLRQRYDQGFPGGQHIMLSPSAINLYMDCPMHFYLDKVLRIRREEEEQEGMPPSIIGNIFHDTAEFFYSQLLKRHGDTNIITASMLCEPNGEIRTSIEHELQLILHTAFDVCWFHPTQSFDRLPELTKRYPQAKELARSNEYKGAVLITHDVLLRYLLNLIRYDARHAKDEPILFVGAEVERNLELTIPTPGGPEGDTIRILTGGRIDRIDIMADEDDKTDEKDKKSEKKKHLRIVDYKTSIKNLEMGKMSMQKVVGLGTDHQGYYLQTFLYALAEMEHHKGTEPIKPVLFFPAKASSKDYDPTLLLDKVPVEDFKEQFAKSFREGIEAILTDIFNPEKPFTCTTNKDKCKYCKLHPICGKPKDSEKNK